jgi:hypothetical protein
MNPAVIVDTWNSATNLVKPEIYLLKSGGSFFAVADDSSSIIFAVSKTKHIYAIAKSKAFINNTPEGIPFYYVPNVDSVKVISCTVKKEAKDKNQKFTIENIISYL